MSSVNVISCVSSTFRRVLMDDWKLQASPVVRLRRLRETYALLIGRV